MRSLKDYLADFPKPDWALYQRQRYDGVVEDVCEHGVGHPNEEFLRRYDPHGYYDEGAHDCCGCCFKEARAKLNENFIQRIFRRFGEWMLK
jgi:hypothetical protein